MDFYSYVDEHIKTISNLSQNIHLNINKSIEIIIEGLNNSKKILICGNGGSAADSQHIAAEFLNTVDKKSLRDGLPAISLSSNVPAITARANDFSFDDIFARQIDALGLKDDILIVISTSGTSTNILEAIKKAKSKELKVIAFTGIEGIKSTTVDLELRAPSRNTQHIQETHIVFYHYICLKVEEYYS